MSEKLYHLSWECDFHTSTGLYAKRFSGSAGKMILGRQNDLLGRFLGNLSGRRVLDVGAGHGQTVEAVISEGGRFTAYGSSEDSFSQLKKVLEIRGYETGAVSLETGRLDKLPFEDGYFDIVISLRLISHVPDWTVFLRELCRIAGSSVIIDFAPGSSDFLKPLSSFLKSKIEVASREFTTQNVDEVKRAALGCGFALRDYEREFAIPMVIHRAVGRNLLLPVERMAQKFRITKFMGGPVIAVFDRIS